MSRPDESAIVITGRGIASSLGDDVVPACAAARAGIVCPAELDFEMKSPTGDIELACGHPARGLTDGFEGFARQLRLTQVALTGLFREVPDASTRAPRTGFYLALPDPLREVAGLALIGDEIDRRAREARARDLVAGGVEQERALRLLSAACRVVEWPSEPSLRFVATSGHSGFAEATLRACADLRAGRISTAIVGGVDSLLDQDTLDWLQATGRLKSRSAPVGLQPGEAGVFLQLEIARSAAMRRARIQGVVRDAQIGTEERTQLSGEHALGEGLASVLSTLAARMPRGSPIFCISDHNGEVFRAMDWGHALARVRAPVPAFADATTWYTAASFGDTGAASGALAICLATAAFDRGYAPASAALIVSAGDGGGRAATLVAAPSS